LSEGALIELVSGSPEETVALGRRLGAAAAAGDVFLLDGPFGAGKTHLVQGLAAGLGVAGVVTSPSFILANEYEGRLPLYHLDLFRLERLDGVTLQTLEDYFYGDGVCAVEWPALLPADLRAAANELTFALTGEESRRIVARLVAPRLAEALLHATGA
jgi:tRNA threonylcarbamoyladenosine biosynthesis protein TsaE